MKKWDFLLAIVLLLIGGVLVLGSYFQESRRTVVCVKVHGDTKGSYPLSEDREVVLWSPEGSNTLRIKEGSVWICEADCPDQICVDTGRISRLGQSIICLPHQVVISIEEDEDE